MNDCTNAVLRRNQQLEPITKGIWLFLDIFMFLLPLSSQHPSFFMDVRLLAEQKLGNQVATV